MVDSQHTVTIQAEKFAEMLQINGKTLLANTLIALVLAYMLRGAISHNILWAWLFATLLVNLARGIAGHYWASYTQDEAANVFGRLKQFRFGVFASGLLWGLVGLLMFTSVEFQHKMLAIYCLAGLSAGAAVSYSIDRYSAYISISCILIPALLGMYLSGNEIFIAMGVSGTLYIIFMAASINSMHNRLTERIKLSIEAVDREAAIKKLAFYDELTDLPNRRLLIDRLSHALTISARTGKRGAILFLDVDDFKKLNDTLGHDMGDLLLKQLSERLLSCVRESDSVARLGGDEFVVMLENLNADYHIALTQVEQICKQIISTLNLPYKLNTEEYQCSSSIGVAMFGEHGTTFEGLLKNADTAMYEAKKAGRNLLQIFSHEMRR
ncbi:MAG TPA: GGDEF domain-containing protein [Methylotenera sp.]|nr:GGDEF domain-containing protein [Methylotenera sp.]HPH05668.1 GGDEF domain-containing protein [Methylotenera sp.]HPN01348.1 GGDEF domain-containing protein [Methylotenera sp.]